MKLLVFIFFSFFLTAQGWAFPDCTGTYWDNCYGTDTFVSTGETYSGEWRDNKRHGLGTQIWGKYSEWEGDKYIGEFKDDLRHGRGSYSYGATGDLYVGEFKEGTVHGQGTLTFGENSEWAGDVYVGAFKENEFHGEGTYKFGFDRQAELVDRWVKNGDRFVGFFANNSPYGEGIYYHVDGNIEEGFWEGWNLVRKKNEDIKERNFAIDSNLPDCEGSYDVGWNSCFGFYVWDNGDRYVGEWHDGVRHGRGTYTFGENSEWAGDKYAGEWKKGIKNGRGTYIFSDGGSYVGEWSNDQMHGHGTRTWNQGDTYVGELMNNKIHGQGTYTWANDVEFEGRQIKSGDRYVGQFLDNRPKGEGIFYHVDGRIEEGVWEGSNLIYAKKITAGSEQRQKHDAQKAWEEAKALKEENEALSQELAQRHSRMEAEKTLKLKVELSVTEPDNFGRVQILVVTNKPLSSLKLNDLEQGGRAEGAYVLDRVAAVGVDTVYRIVATDEFGDEVSKSVSVRRALPQVDRQFEPLDPTKVLVKAREDAVAIIIGINNYERLPNADFADRDAAAFYDYANRVLGVPQHNIKLLMNEKADRLGLLQAFEHWLPSVSSPEKVEVFVFYSGHGLPSFDGEERYFLPSDVAPEFLSETALTHDRLFQQVSAVKPKHVTFFIDSCYSGLNRDGETLLDKARPVTLQLKSGAVPPKFTVFSASGLGEISSGSTVLQHGIFSFFLMKGLEGVADIDSDQTISNNELYDYVKRSVSSVALQGGRKQTPTISGESERIIVNLGSENPR